MALALCTHDRWPADAMLDRRVPAQTSRVQGRSGLGRRRAPAGRRRLREPDRGIEQRNERLHLRIEPVTQSLRKALEDQEIDICTNVPAVQFCRERKDSSPRPYRTRHRDGNTGGTHVLAALGHKWRRCCRREGLGFCLGRPDPVQGDDVCSLWPSRKPKKEEWRTSRL
jgi:hypothetical protein